MKSKKQLRRLLVSERIRVMRLLIPLTVPLSRQASAEGVLRTIEGDDLALPSTLVLTDAMMEATLTTLEKFIRDIRERRRREGLS